MTRRRAARSDQGVAVRRPTRSRALPSSHRHRACASPVSPCWRASCSERPASARSVTNCHKNQQLATSDALAGTSRRFDSCQAQREQRSRRVTARSAAGASRRSYCSGAKRLAEASRWVSRPRPGRRHPGCRCHRPGHTQATSSSSRSSWSSYRRRLRRTERRRSRPRSSPWSRSCPSQASRRGR